VPLPEPKPVPCPCPGPVSLLQISKCQAGERAGRLYVTDGSMPDYEEQGYPRDAPGGRARA